MTISFPGILNKISQRYGPNHTLAPNQTSISKESLGEIKHLPPTTLPRRPPPSKPSDFCPNDKYTNLLELEPGDEGTCAVLRSDTTGRVYVRKHLRAPSPEAPRKRKPPHLSPPPAPTGKRKALPPEARMLLCLKPDHPNIIKYFGCEPDPSGGGERWNIYLEYCTGGDLLDQLRAFRSASHAPGPTSPAVFTLHVIVSLAQALAYLHHGLRWKTGTQYQSSQVHEPVLHGDIKPDNLFLRHHSRSQIKGMPDIVLGDFGMAQFASQSTGITGTPGYDSPEVRAVANLRDTNPTLYTKRSVERVMTTKSDVYQMGLIMYLMSTGRHWKCGADPSTLNLQSEEYKDIIGFTALLVWFLQPEQEDRPECTGDLELGCLFAIDVLRKKRDELIEQGAVKDLEGKWCCSMKLQKEVERQSKSR